MATGAYCQPPGHVWPPPTIVSTSTAVPAPQPPVRATAGLRCQAAAPTTDVDQSITAVGRTT